MNMWYFKKINLSLLWLFLFASQGSYSEEYFNSLDYYKFSIDDDDKKSLMESEGLYFTIKSIFSSKIQVERFSDKEYYPIGTTRYFKGSEEIDYKAFYESIGLGSYLSEYQYRIKEKNKNLVRFAIFEGITGSIITIDIMDYILHEALIYSDEHSVLGSDSLRLGVGVTAACCLLFGGMAFYSKQREIGEIEKISVEEIIRNAYEINQKIIE